MVSGLKIFLHKSAVFFSIIEKNFIQTGGSFSETFYGLKRIAVLSSGVGGNLSWKRQKLSILLLILDPYLRAKAEKYKLDEIDGRFPKKASLFIIAFYSSQHLI